MPGPKFHVRNQGLVNSDVVLGLDISAWPCGLLEWAPNSEEGKYRKHTSVQVVGDEIFILKEGKTITSTD